MSGENRTVRLEKTIIGDIVGPMELVHLSGLG
jgi:hypothetical protein